MDRTVCVEKVVFLSTSKTIFQNTKCKKINIFFISLIKVLNTCTHHEAQRIGNDKIKVIVIPMPPNIKKKKNRETGTTMAIYFSCHGPVYAALLILSVF